MNRTLLLLLVTLIQSLSNGVVLSGPNNSNKFEENFEDFSLEDWNNSGSPYPSDMSKVFKSYKKRSTSDVLTRRSMLDKTFMRFGRNAEDSCTNKECVDALKSQMSQSDSNQYHRVARGMADDFIRFGRRPQDNFIRFGRTGSEESNPRRPILLFLRNYIDIKSLNSLNINDPNNSTRSAPGISI